MDKDEVIRMAREAGWDETFCKVDNRPEKLIAIAFAAGQRDMRERCIECAYDYVQFVTDFEHADELKKDMLELEIKK